MIYKKQLTVLISVPFLLLIPYIANQFIHGVDWSLIDFILMGSLLLFVGLLCEFAIRNVKKLEHRLAICGGFLLVLLLIWAELAVGIFGSHYAGS